MKKLKSFDETVTVVENKRINEKYYRLTFASADLSRHVFPGQFLQVKINPTMDPFLRRPFSYYRVDKNKVQILYEVLGRGTALLAEKKKGDSLLVMGPLGKPFSKTIPAAKRVLIAGGVGVPPLVFLAERYGADYFLIGTKSRGEILPRKELGKIKATLLYATNDGSYGKKGFVTGLLEEVLKQEKPEKLFIQTCGPRPMMESVLQFAEKFRIDGELSIDKTMACGVGACLGCMVKTIDGWKPSCTEGPVFPFSKIDRSQPLV